MGFLRGPNFAIRTAKRWTAHELISLICDVEKIFKRKHLDFK